MPHYNAYDSFKTKRSIEKKQRAKEKSLGKKSDFSDEFVIHEGTRVDITDDTMNDWKGIRLADGKEGWILTKQLEKI